MWYSKCWPLWPEFILSFVQRNVSSRGWVLFHILLHPVWELLFIPKSKPYSFPAVSFEAGLYIIARLSRVFRSVVKSVSFRHTENMNGFLESGWTLLVKNFYIKIKFTIPIVSRFIDKWKLYSTSRFIQRLIVKSFLLFWLIGLLCLDFFLLYGFDLFIFVLFVRFVCFFGFL